MRPARTATTLLLLAAFSPAAAMPPPWTHEVPDARVTRIHVDNGLTEDHTVCIEHPLPDGGFKPEQLDIVLRQDAPDHLQVSLMPLTLKGEPCVHLRMTKERAAQFTLTITDQTRPYDLRRFYSGPLLGIPERAK